MFGALSQAQINRLLFVPVMLDADAKVWWASLKKEGELNELPVDFQYADFTRNGVRIDFREDENEAKDKATKLALRIRKILQEPPPMPRPPLPSRSPSPSPLGQVVVLGHPTARLPEDLWGEVESVKALLQGRAVPFEAWSDGWARDPAARARQGGAVSGIFVRPLSELEAEVHVREPSRTAQQLAAIGDINARVALWLPSGREDQAFQDAAGRAQAGTYPALRTDTPAGLGTWLAELLQEADPTSDMVIQIEDVGSPEGSAPNVEAIRLSTALRDGFCGVVGGEVSPEPQSWRFWDEQFREQFAILPGSRAIVAVHDLNVPTTTSPREARQRIEARFQQINDDVDAAIQKFDPGRELKLFKTLLVINNAKKFPFATWPFNGRWKDWRLLSFDRTGEPTAPGALPKVRPKPSSLALFRSDLRDWATGRE